MSLCNFPVSDTAKKFVSVLTDAVAAETDRSNSLRPSSRAKLLDAVGAITADILRASEDGRIAKRTTDKKSLIGSPIKWTSFNRAYKALESRDMLGHARGYFDRSGPFGAVGGPAIFCATQKLMSKAVAAGIEPNTWRDHFKPLKPTPAPSSEFLRLKAAKQGGNAPVIPFDISAAKPAAIISDLQRLNDYLTTRPIDGVAFSGLRRVFSWGDVPDYAWDKGGRYYSISQDAYENWPGGAKTRESYIRLDGEPVVHADVSAAQLTIYYGLQGQPFDPSADPYAIDGINRSDIKDFITKCWGKAELGSGPLRASVVAKHPILSTLDGALPHSVILQHHDSELLRLAMDYLMEKRITFLPVHDALMVPQSRLEDAREAWRVAFRDYFIGLGLPPIIPRIK